VNTSIDDNKKVTVDEYRRLVYGITAVEPKPKALSSSLGAGSVSPKYQPNANKSTVTFSSGKNDPRQEIAKKYSYDRVKPASQVNYEESIKKQQMQQLQQEKPLIKYVRSATNITKPEHNQHFPAKRDGPHYDVPNREETDPNISHHYPEQRPATYANFNNMPKYNYSKPNEPLKAPQIPVGYSMPNGYMGSNSNWKAVKSPPNATVLTSN
jgi:hypothetical protein